MRPQSCASSLSEKEKGKTTSRKIKRKKYKIQKK